MPPSICVYDVDKIKLYIDGLMLHCSNSSANELELPLHSCTKPSIWQCGQQTSLVNRICYTGWVMFITRVSEVIMFSPCVFVCDFVCLCLYHDVCPDDLAMKNWCHTNNILQVHCWGYLVVQVMFHAVMTSSMTPPGHKVSQILKVIYLRQYLS